MNQLKAKFDGDRINKLKFKFYDMIKLGDYKNFGQSDVSVVIFFLTYLARRDINKIGITEMNAVCSILLPILRNHVALINYKSYRSLHDIKFIKSYNELNEMCSDNSFMQQFVAKSTNNSRYNSVIILLNKIFSLLSAI